jgi:hypothetical protein
MPSSSSPNPEKMSQPSAGAAFYRPSFWAALLIPFCLDLLVGGSLLTSILGSATWTLLITLSSWKPQVRDTKLRGFFSRAEVGIWILYLMSWTYLFLKGPYVDNIWIRPLSRSWLVSIHAFLLAGSSGLVFLFGLSSLAAHFQIQRLQSNSWQRRTTGRFFKSLPSLESLTKVSSMAVFWAFTAWGVGLALAFLTLLATYGPSSNASSITELNLSIDPKIFLTTFLWLILLSAFLIQNHSQWNPRRRAHWLMSLSFVFWIFLVFQAFYQFSSFHEPVRWFLK